MANRYGYMTAVLHTIGEDGKTIPVGSSNSLPVVGSGAPVLQPIMFRHMVLYLFLKDKSCIGNSLKISL